MNSSARRTCTVGEIVNLVSADTQKLMDFVVYFNAVWLAPIEVTLCLFFLWQVRAHLFAIIISQYLGMWLNISFSFPIKISKTFLILLISAFGTISACGHCHSDFHLSSERIHCKKEKQTPGIALF